MYRFFVAAVVPLTLAGCASASGPADVISASSAVNPGVGIRNTHHHTVLDGYTHRVPVEPKPWRQQNESQAPGAGVGS